MSKKSSHFSTTVQNSNTPSPVNTELSKLELERTQAWIKNDQANAARSLIALEMDKKHLAILELEQVVGLRIESARRNIEVLLKVHSSGHGNEESAELVVSMLNKNLALLDASQISLPPDKK